MRDDCQALGSRPSLAAIRGFQSDHGLPVTGLMNNDTWRALVTEYLALDSLAVPDSQFLPNANDTG